MDKIKNCTACIGCSIPIVGAGGKGGLMIVTDRPTKNETTVMSSDFKYNILNKVLDSVIKVDYSIIYKTNFLKCCPTIEITDEMKKECLKNLKKEIEEIQPKAILFLGSFAHKTIFKKEKSIYDLIKTVETFQDISCYFTYAPLHVSKNVNLIQSFAERINQAYNKVIGVPTKKVDSIIKSVQTFDELEQLCTYIEQTKVFSHDFETTGLDTWAEDFKLTSLSISFQHGSAYVIPLWHFENKSFEGREIQVLEFISKRILENGSIEKVAQNVDYEMKCWNSVGINNFKGVWHDPMLMHHELYSDQRHGLKKLVSQYFPQYAGYEDEVGQFKWDAIPWKIQAQYNGLDSDLTLRVKTHLEAVLIKDGRAYTCYRNLMTAGAKSMFNMSNNGMVIDIDYLDKAILDVRNMVEIADKEIRKIPQIQSYELYMIEQTKKDKIEFFEAKLAKWLLTHKEGTKTEHNYKDKIQAIKLGTLSTYEGISFGSWQQLSKLLYTKQGFDYSKPLFTKGGGTDAATLKELKDKSGFVESLIVLRSLNKTLSTYLIGMQNVMTENKVHPQFRLAGTTSKRLSCTTPNLQNLSQSSRVKNPLLKKAVEYVRGMFIVPKGYTLIQCDFSQLELRLAALIAQVESMLDSYDLDIDLHSQCAADMMGITIEEFYELPKDVQKLSRFNNKAVNFGYIYGQEPSGFQMYAKNTFGLELSLKECQRQRGVYFSKKQELIKYYKETELKAIKFGHVRTYLGSRCGTTDATSPIPKIQAHALRSAINARVQGTGGQLNILAGILLKDRLDERTLHINNIHDANLFFIPTEILEQEVAIIKECSENLPLEDYFGVSASNPEGKRGIKLKVDFEYSTTNWLELAE